LTRPGYQELVEFIAAHFKRVDLFSGQMAVKPKEIFLAVDLDFLGPDGHIKSPADLPQLLDETWPQFA
jgi:hypothetical protein